ncbi:hypothetical protein [Streptomyces sp. NPDC045251]|uniref:hypothetical protein n=1 Tax=unclassified Streptomyces TaxID=2593676 RepID=UPI0033C6C6D1
MIGNTPAHSTTVPLLGSPASPDRRPRSARTPGASRPERGSSPREGQRLRPLSRRQIEDHLQELGDLYADTSGGGPLVWNQARGAYLRQLTTDVRRPGFELLIAESTGMTGCAHGFPVRGDGPWWAGSDRHLPGHLLRLAAAGRLFVISGIHVPSRVRRQNPDRAWNLARRMQKRLLADHGIAVAVTLVERSDRGTAEALRSWGWRYVDGGTARTVPLDPFRVLVLET